ncbi:hypothetical protein BD413DRAFT_617750 [Trametes elegans]|nr:hypothetical protein BD413DRAFT_617750 [Trametes elegans]
MLALTFMGAHFSFAMVAVVDQTGQLRSALGSIIGLFGLVRWMPDLLTGRRPIVGALRASEKPLVIFLLAIFGVPYAMHKLLRVLAEQQQQQQQQAQLAGGAGAGAGPLPPLDPSQLTFARALYPFDASSPAELALKEN